MKHFSLIIMALTAFMLGIVWVVGSGEAVQVPKNKLIYLAADSIHINLEDGEVTTEKPKADDSRETLFKEIKKLNQTVYDIKSRYMEDVDVSELVKSGIKGMLEELDRFSVLMEKQSYDRLMESTHGKYEGLGMEIDARDNHIIVVTPMEGMPASKVGLRSGDQIHEIDGQSTYKMSTSDAAKLMRGPAGTRVNLKVMREGLMEPLDFEVERAVIELKSVNYYGIIENTDIGYIRLSRFAEETGNELVEAITELNERGIAGLIFDLRSNGGGLLNQAVETAELFVPEGSLIVYTQGKSPGSERRHYSRKVPLYPDKPLAILVNEGTASASEIVAGAVQDWDRGIIMGYPTYGKGLVQQLFPIGSDDDIALKLTTAKYYIPSGRCIQKSEVSEKPGHDSAMAVEGDSVTVDSLRFDEENIYYTGAGRIVYGGGGILPDIELEDDRTAEPIEINLERKRIFFDYAVTYVANHPEAARDIVITDEILDDFKNYLKEKEFSYKTSLEISLEKMHEIVSEEKKDSIFAMAFDDFEKLIEKEKEMDFKRSEDYIKKAIKREIVGKIVGQRGIYEEVVLKTDPAVLEALELLQDGEKYTEILTEGQHPDQSQIGE